jgi:hypothetical protein
MNRARILLSSKERKALFRAVQIFTEQRIEFRDTDSVEDLLTELDDGGIWNPCMLEIPASKTEVQFLDFAVRRGEDIYPEYAHTLQMIRERLLYIYSRRDERKEYGRWPFLTSGKDYGASWEDARESAIRRDRFKCYDCGLTQKSHNSMYGQDLHVHHIKPKSDCDTFSEANKLENLVTLCRRCHFNRDPTFLED